MITLGIETSCDETAVAVVRGERAVMSSVVSSQAALHAPYGGVVPEIASRSHVEALPALLEQGLREADARWADIDRIAVTYGPGLASSLLVGVAAARALAFRLDRPLFAENHLHAHIYAPFLDPAAPPIADVCPFLALVVSGGHTCLVRVEGLGRYRLLGQTVDDAAGEAFDKGATLLGLGYPGGPAIERAARAGDPGFVDFPRGRQRKPFAGLDPELCFSFSGLKTALLYYLKEHPLSADGSDGSDSSDLSDLSDVAASYQAAIVEALVARCGRALDGMRALAAGGGVSLNASLRRALGALAAERGVRLLLAPPAYCGDNAAMIAALAGAGQGIRGEAAATLDIDPSLPVA